MADTSRFRTPTRPSRHTEEQDVEVRGQVQGEGAAASFCSDETAGAATESVSVWVCVIELESSGFPETPVAVSVTGALVTGAFAAAFRQNVWGDPIPTVAEPGATPTPDGSPLSTSVMLPAEPLTALTWNVIGVVPPCVIEAVAVCPLTSESAKSGGPLLPQPANAIGRAQASAATRKFHRPRIRAKSSRTSSRIEMRLGRYSAQPVKSAALR
jgi:hypothetical protein